MAAAIAIAAAAWAADRVHERSLEQRSAHRVAIEVVEDDPTADGDVVTDLTLVNRGPEPVRVIDASFDLPGVPVVRVDEWLAAGAQTSVALADDRPCTPSLITRPPKAALLHLRTARGQRLTRRPPLPDGLAATMTAYARFRCGQKAPADALRADLIKVEGGADTLTVTVAFTNTSTLPLRLGSLVGPAGVLVEGIALPLDLQAESQPGVVPLPTVISLRLRASGCVPPQDAPVELLARVASPYESGTAPVDFDGSGGAKLLSGLRALCGARRAG